MLHAMRRARQRGFSLIVVFLLFAVMATAAAAVLLSTRRDIQVSGRDREQSVAFFAAEAGLAYAKNTLSTEWSPNGRWTPVLNGPMGTGVTVSYDVGGLTVGTEVLPLLKARYTYRVRNNANDPSGDPLVDGDGIIIVRSTGDALDAGGTRVIATATVEVEVLWDAGTVGAGDYQAQAGQSSSGVAKSADTKAVDTGGKTSF